MKNINKKLFLFVVLITFFICSNNITTNNIYSKNKINEKTIKSKIKYTYHPNGKIKTKTEQLNDERTDYYLQDNTNFHHSGGKLDYLQTHTVYNDKEIPVLTKKYSKHTNNLNKDIVVTITYHSNGNQAKYVGLYPLDWGQFEEDVTVTIIETYNEKGIVTKTLKILPNGKTYEEAFYHDNGNISKFTNHRNGVTTIFNRKGEKIRSVWKTGDTSNNVIVTKRIIYYNNDIKTKETSYYSNGVMASLVYYDNKGNIILYTTWRSNRTKSHHASYSANKSVTINYYPNGRNILNQTTITGANKIIVYYYETGITKKRVIYNKGIKNIVTYFYRDGIISQKESYYLNGKINFLTIYDKLGMQTLIYIYDMQGIRKQIYPGIG